MKAEFLRDLDLTDLLLKIRHKEVWCSTSNQREKINCVWIQLKRKYIPNLIFSIAVIYSLINKFSILFKLILSNVRMLLNDASNFFFLSFLSPPVHLELYSKFWLLVLFCISLERLDRILVKPHHIIFMMYIMPETFTTTDSLQHYEILRRAY